MKNNEIKQFLNSASLEKEIIKKNKFLLINSDLPSELILNYLDFIMKKQDMKYLNILNKSMLNEKTILGLDFLIFENRSILNKNSLITIITDGFFYTYSNFLETLELNLKIEKKSLENNQRNKIDIEITKSRILSLDNQVKLILICHPNTNKPFPKKITEYLIENDLISVIDLKNVSKDYSLIEFYEKK